MKFMRQKLNNSRLRAFLTTLMNKFVESKSATVPFFKLRATICLLLFVFLSSSAVYGSNPYLPPGTNTPPDLLDNPIIPELTIPPPNTQPEEIDPNGDGSKSEGCNDCSVAVSIKLSDSSEEFGTRHLTLHQLQPSATLVSPANFHFSSPISAMLVSNTTSTTSNPLPAGAARNWPRTPPSG